jgi:hypothetical protein
MMKRRMKDDEVVEHVLKFLAERGPMTLTGLADYMRFAAGGAPRQDRLMAILIQLARRGTVEMRRSPSNRYVTFRFVLPEERKQPAVPLMDEVAAPAAELSRPAAPALAAAILDLSAALTLHAEAIAGYAEMVKAACAPPPPSKFNGPLRDHAAIPTAG